MATDLHALADSVNDEKGFIRFLFALAEDWEAEQAIEASTPSSPYGPGALGWENGTVGAVLERAASWGEASIDGLRFYEKPSNPWRRAAQILKAGKFYE